MHVVDVPSTFIPQTCTFGLVTSAGGNTFYLVEMSSQICSESSVQRYKRKKVMIAFFTRECLM